MAPNKSVLDLLNYTEPAPEKKGGYRRRFTKYDPEDPEQEKEETPPIATEMLLSVEKFSGNILEPCAGRGGVTRVLQDAGHDVTSIDLIPKAEGIYEKDFFTVTEKWDNIIGAPPMKLAGGMAYHAIEHARKKVAFLVRATFLENRARREMLFDNPALPTCFEKLYVFTDRLPYGEGNMIMYAWFIWNKRFRGTPTVHWL